MSHLVAVPPELAVLAIALSIVRVVAAVVTVPLFPRARGGVLLRLAVAFSFAMALVPVMLPGIVGALAASPTPLSMATAIAIRELGIGLALGLAAAVVLSVGRLAGGMVDSQLPGWRSGDLLARRQRTGAFAAFLFLATITLFLSLDGHIVLLEGIAASARGWPPQETAPATDLTAVAAASLESAGMLFGIALAAVLPALATMALAEVLVGLGIRIAGWSTGDASFADSIRSVVGIVTLLATAAVVLRALGGWMLLRIASHGS